MVFELFFGLLISNSYFAAQPILATRSGFVTERRHLRAPEITGRLRCEKKEQDFKS
jgi:hypothetical protein